MRTTSSGRFTIDIGGAEKEVVVSLGLKAELYKLITKSQIALAQQERRVYMDEALSAKIKEADMEVRRLEAEQAPEEQIEIAKASLELLYAEAMADIQAKERIVLEENIAKRIDLTEMIFAEAISCLLSERDEFGKIVNRIDPQEIMWSPVYGEAQEELAELLYSVTEYITSALKKISAISDLINDVTPSKKEESLL